jgi:hypothetical protein
MMNAEREWDGRWQLLGQLWGNLRPFLIGAAAD